MTIKKLSPDRLYLVALSGGADSVALALMMKERGLNVHALHCNYHLRGKESDRDENFVRHFCDDNNIPLEVCHFDTRNLAKMHGMSIEMEARELRYTWFAEQAQTLKAEAICVAHHKDDQAETLLLNLIRGTGMRGLAAMHPDRTINGLRILRPLLDITKQEILDYLASRHQEYVTDSTNLERDALRNRIRLDVIPMLRELNPNITDCLARTAYNVRMELDADSEEASYHKWLAPLGFSRQQILDIYAHRPHGSDETISATGQIWHSSTHSLLMDRGKWILQEKTEDNAESVPELVITRLPSGTVIRKEDFTDRQQALVDADSISGTLELRYVQTGDRFRPFGFVSGSKLVSDYLTDRKVSLFDKQKQLVAIDSATQRIVWLVGREIDNRYRITQSTKNILRITCR